MNLVYSYNQESEIEYEVGIAPRRTAKEKVSTAKSRRPNYSRTSRPSVMHNGIHRRRNKRFSW